MPVDIYTRTINNSAVPVVVLKYFLIFFIARFFIINTTEKCFVTTTKKNKQPQYLRYFNMAQGPRGGERIDFINNRVLINQVVASAQTKIEYIIVPWGYKPSSFGGLY